MEFLELIHKEIEDRSILYSDGGQYINYFIKVIFIKMEASTSIIS